MSKSLRITLVTPSLNQAAYLGECLLSVRSQEGVDVEHIVVDGGSTDGSREIIGSAADGLSWWCSEPDRGQSHAINKGLARASGGVFGWLNSDDLLLPGALRQVAKAFAEDESLVVLSGLRLVREQGRADRALPLEEHSDRMAWLTRPRINQQSTFFRTEALRSLGGVEERLRFVMDFELWIQLVLRYPESAFRIVPWELAVFRHHADSKTATSQPAFVEELASVLHGLCEQAGLVEQARAMALGHRITPHLRRMPVGVADRDLVDRMAWRFMLKWHPEVYSRTDLRMMRSWIALEPPEGFLDALEKERLSQLRESTRSSNWLCYRLLRKIKHLAR